MAAMQIRPVAPGDEHGISELYNHYISHSTVTFEEEPLSAAAMHERIELYRAHYPWLVAEMDGHVVGYSYASKFHPRAAYRHTVESTVYVRQGFGGRGLGKALYEPLLARLCAQGCHVALAAIALPNHASVSLHEACGFHKVGHFTQVGRKFGQWLDVGYWEKRLVPADQQS